MEKRLKNEDVFLLRKQYDETLSEAFEVMDNIVKYREWIAEEQRKLRRLNLKCQVFDEQVNIARADVIKKRVDEDHGLFK